MLRPFVGPLDCARAVGRPGLGSECKLQCELDLARVAGTLDAPEIRSIGDITIRVQELGRVEDVEELSAKLKAHGLFDRSNLLYREVKVIDARSAANIARAT